MNENPPLALIIEDDRKLVDIFARALADAGFETETVQDGRLAAEKIATTIPTIILLDLHLPFISGEELLRQIKADERLQKTRVILASADSRLSDLLRDQVDVVLDKPISFRHLRLLAARFNPLQTGESE